MIVMMGCAGIVTVTARGIEDDDCLFSSALCQLINLLLFHSGTLSSLRLAFPLLHPIKLFVFHLGILSNLRMQ